jgi:hypothetical protein
MAHKRKTVSARLSRYLGPSPYPYIGPEIDWNDPSIWTAAAREAFDLADLERATKIAFSKFHLDPIPLRQLKSFRCLFRQSHRQEIFNGSQNQG